MPSKSGTKGRAVKSHRNQGKSELLSSVHGNREQLETVSRRLEERKTEERKANEESKTEEKRVRLRSLADQPIATQIEAFPTFPAWFGECDFYKIPNKKFDQIKALASLQSEREIRLKSRDKKLCLDDLMEKKKCQYRERLKRHPVQSPDFVRMYTCAEYALQEWAEGAGLNWIDRNIENLYDPQDYTIRGKDIDVKSTISYPGNWGGPQLKSYWSPDPNTPGEIICAIRSELRKGSPYSTHFIQGIFDPSVYDVSSVPLRLHHFTLKNNWLNPCYFQPPEAFFKVHRPISLDFDRDVLEFCKQNNILLPEIFRSNEKEGIALLREALPECHKDFADIASRLVIRGTGELLPHYLADYVITKIFEKSEIDSDGFEKALSVIDPNPDQKEFLNALINTAKILPQVKCAHCGESIRDMGIKLTLGTTTTKIILKALCSEVPHGGLTTTFLAYSWKTGETLVYGDPGVSTCDIPTCRCLTHVSGGKRTGRRGCPGNGDPYA